VITFEIDPVCIRGLVLAWRREQLPVDHFARVCLLVQMRYT